MSKRRITAFGSVAVMATVATLFLRMTAMAHADEPTTDPSDGPREAIDAFAAAIAHGDAATIGRRIAATNADEAALRPALAEAAAAIGAFEAALAARFGAAAATTPTTRPAAAEVATIRQDGAWRLTFAGVATATDARGFPLFVPSDEPARRLVEMRAALDAVTLDVRAGHYPIAAAAIDAAHHAWSDAARGAQAQ